MPKMPEPVRDGEGEEKEARNGEAESLPSSSGRPTLALRPNSLTRQRGNRVQVVTYFSRTNIYALVRPTKPFYIL